jgi:predicted PurR-regulated permease PerM
VAGIFGALIAVPLTAIINAVASYLASGRAASPEQDALDQQDAGAAADPAVAP